MTTDQAARLVRVFEESLGADHDDTLVRIECKEMADGSGDWALFAETYDVAGEQFTFRTIAEGMRRYGFRDEASRVAIALLEAAEAFDGRLPELFAGFDRAETGFPVEYDGASRPQSFAAGAPLMALRTLLGLDVRDGVLSVEPVFPESVGRLALRGLPVHGRRVDAG